MSVNKGPFTFWLVGEPEPVLLLHTVNLSWGLIFWMDALNEQLCLFTGIVSLDLYIHCIDSLVTIY